MDLQIYEFLNAIENGGVCDVCKRSFFQDICQMIGPLLLHVSWQQLTLYLISLGNLRQEGTFHRELQMSHFPFSTATLQLFIAILFVDELFKPSAFGNSWTINEPGGFVIVTKHLVFLLCLGKIANFWILSQKMEKNPRSAINNLWVIISYFELPNIYVYI